MHKWVSCHIVLLLTCTALIYAQDLQTNPLTSNMPNRIGAARAITQDMTGFIWIGSRYGLYRYDGRELLPFRSDPRITNGLSDNDVYLLSVDGNQGLWIATAMQGIDFLSFADSSFAHYSLSGETPQSFLRCEDGAFFVSSSEGGFYTFDRGADRFIKINLNYGETLSQPGGNIVSMFERSDETLLIHIEGSGPYALERGTWEVHTLSGTGEQSYDIARWGDAIFTKSPGNDLMAGSWGGGIVTFTDGGWQPLSAVNVDGALFIRDVIADGKGSLWLATLESGVVRISFTGARSASYEVVSDSERLLPQCLFLDRSGTLWIGHEYGVSTYSPYRTKFENHMSRPEGGGATVLSIIELSSEQVLVGTRQGLFGYNLATGETDRISVLVDGEQYQGPIFALERSIDDSIFIGCGEGLLKYDHKKGRFTRLTEIYQVVDVECLEDGSVWFSTVLNGLGYLSAGSDSVEYWGPVLDEPDSAGFSPSGLHYDSDGNLWIGSDNRGLFQLQNKESNYLHYEHQKGAVSISDNRVTCLEEDASGNMWVGTRSGLNHIIVDSNMIESWTLEKSLPDSSIMALLSDNSGRLWVSSLGGLSAVSLDEGSVRNYTTADGLQSPFFSPRAAHLGASGRAYFGGINGFVTFTPDALPQNQHQPTTAITGMSIFGEPRRWPMNAVEYEVELPHDQNVLTFTFAALDFADPQRNRFEYQLEGHSDAWVPLGTSNSFTAARLPPGNYTLHVKSRNADGVEGTEAVLPIRITPPFWSTGEFRLFLLIIVVLLILGLHRVRTRSIVRQRDSLALEVARRNEVEGQLLSNQSRLRSLAARLTLVEQQERRKISSTLHDTIGHSLFLTKIRLAEYAENEELTERQEMLLNIQNVISDTLRITRNLTAEISPPALHKFGLETTAERLIEKIGKEHGIQTIVNRCNKPVSLTYDVAVLVYQSLREMMMNVVKHAGATVMKLICSAEEDTYHFTLQDDGGGFNVAELDDDSGHLSGYGLFSIRERMEAVRGEMKISSQIGIGTEITLIVPGKAEEEHGN